MESAAGRKFQLSAGSLWSSGQQGLPGCTRPILVYASVTDKDHRRDSGSVGIESGLFRK